MGGEYNTMNASSDIQQKLGKKTSYLKILKSSLAIVLKKAIEIGLAKVISLLL